MEFLSLICGGMQFGELLYIDPAATSVLLSSVAAIAVAIAASAIVIWKKVKNNVKKIVKTDPNKNKEVEKDIVLVDEEALKGQEKENKEEASQTKTTEKETKTEVSSTKKQPQKQESAKNKQKK